MRAKRACAAWNSFMEELRQVVMESDGAYCKGAYEKAKSLGDEVGDALRRAYGC